MNTFVDHNANLAEHSVVTGVVSPFGGPNLGGVEANPAHFTGGGGGDQPKGASAPPPKQEEKLVEASPRGHRYTEGVNRSYQQAGLEAPFPEATAGGGEPTPPFPIENKAPAIAPTTPTKEH